MLLSIRRLPEIMLYTKNRVGHIRVNKICGQDVRRIWGCHRGGGGYIVAIGLQRRDRQDFDRGLPLDNDEVRLGRITLFLLLSSQTSACLYIRVDCLSVRP
jgi:hypothetical protein